MKKLLLFILILVYTDLSAQYTWQALPNAPKSWRLDDVFFLTPKLGWAIHGLYYGSYPQFGQIYKTRNAGNTWQLIKDSSETFYRAVGFADSLTGWVGNLADTNRIGGFPITPDTTALYQTNNGGTTWVPANLPYPHPQGICGISVVGDSVVYAYGRWNCKYFNFYHVGYVKTINKGLTWTYHDMSPYFYGMVDGWFFNKDTGFITGASSTYKAQILSTVDGGNTWQVAYKSTRMDTDEVWKIFFPSRDTGYASIEYQARVTPPTAMYFLKTTNGGQSWTEMPFFNNYDEEGIGFINDTIGWIGGDGSQRTYITYNGGQSWAQDYNFGVSTPPYGGTLSYQINRFRKLNDTLMYSSGNTIYKLSGKITGINELVKDQPKIENYPNPYISQTIIEYNLTQNCNNVKLDIFAATGELIFSQNLGFQNQGKHKYEFTQGIPSGAYYYRITSDEYTITREMLRVK